MHQLKSANPYPTDDSVGASIYAFCMGVCLTIFGIWGSRFGWQVREFAWTLFCVLVLLFGMAMMYGGILAVRLFRRIGKARASISEPVIKLGDDFHFNFQQDCWGDIRVNSLSFFLVFREKVDYCRVGEGETRYVDRLVQQVEVPGRTYSNGESINHECVFHLPARKMGIRNRYMAYKEAKVQTMWVVKVCLNINKTGDKVRAIPRKVNDIWKECEVEISGEPSLHPGNNVVPDLCERFDVFLVKDNFLAHIRHANIIDPLFPHLNSVQRNEFFGPIPSWLCERVTREQAQHVQTQLEAIHIQVEIKPPI